MRQRKGSCVWINPRDGRPYARVWWYDENGKRKEKRRRTATRTQAKDLAREMLAEVETHGGASLENSRRTFGELLEYYSAHYLKPAEYVEGRKVAGLRSHKRVASLLKPLAEAFGRRPVRSITYEDLRRYKARRLAVPVLRGSGEEKREVARAVASVNRELAMLRRLLNIARRLRWITSNPFAEGEPLVSAADEAERVRIVSRDEEARLLEAAGSVSATLRAAVAAAVDTALREGELLKLRWRDVDLDAGLIFVPAMNTKTMRPRVVPITARVRGVLLGLRGEGKEPEARVFGRAVTEREGYSLTKGFARARSLCGLDDVRFHDLRHTAITRMLEAGTPESKVMKISGHTTLRTFLRYVNPDTDFLREAGAALDRWREGKGGGAESEVVN